MNDQNLKNLFIQSAPKLSAPSDEWNKIEAKISNNPFDIFSKYVLSSGAIAVVLLTIVVLNTNKDIKDLSQQEINLTIDYITEGMDYNSDELYGWVE